MAIERVERRLTAIFAGDIAGYSRLMGADEEGTLARINTLRREYLDHKIAEHRGRVVKRTGDGILIEFASAVDAARCAVEMQHGMGERNAPVSPDKRIICQPRQRPTRTGVRNEVDDRLKVRVAHRGRPG